MDRPDLGLGLIQGAPPQAVQFSRRKAMPMLPLPCRVECLNEIRPGKICGAHRLSNQSRCSVCGIPSRTRPVNAHRVVSSRFKRPRVSLVLVVDCRAAS